MTKLHVSFLGALTAALLLPFSAQAGRIIWPCSGYVTSPFGPRSSPCSGCSTYHYGIDIGVGSGTILGSPGNGTVTSYAYDSCGGNIYKIGYGSGWETRFLHCSASLRGVGSAVTRNVDVAKSGATGSCLNGAHLHFEVRRDGVAQSVPGSTNTYVTRGTEVPQDYPGLNDISYNNPSYYFDSGDQGWNRGGHSMTGPIWQAPGGWPGIIYGDQTGPDAHWYGPDTSYTGGGDPSVNVQVFPQSGSSANHDMQLFWRTSEENFYTAEKSSQLVNYVAKDGWYSINLSLNNPRYWGKNITGWRLDFDNNNVGARFIVNHMLLQTTPRYFFGGGTDGWASINAVTGLVWHKDSFWGDIVYCDQYANDSHIESPRFAPMLGGFNDVLIVRVYPQSGNSPYHDMQVFWKTNNEEFYSAEKSSPIANYTAQDNWIEVWLDCGKNGKWGGNFITQLRLDFDNINKGNRWIVDHVMVHHTSQ